MVFFIVFLRALAAILITNAHYTNIYPIELIANGGLIGDILFFSVSGYCLASVRTSFFCWYGKRLLRIYPSVILITAIYLLLGLYPSDEHSLFWWLIYPTYYHFVRSILLLYIPYYFIASCRKLRARIPTFMAALSLLWLLSYLFLFDRSYYHLDSVYEPMILFLFFQSMLIGLWFRDHDETIRNHFSRPALIVLLVSVPVYFFCKLWISKGLIPPQFQFVTQLTILVLLFSLFRVCAGSNRKLEALPRGVKTLLGKIAALTLEIYVVQHVLIRLLRFVGPFPINWLAVTAAIFCAAALLHWFSIILVRALSRIFIKANPS